MFGGFFVCFFSGFLLCWFVALLFFSGLLVVCWSAVWPYCPRHGGHFAPLIMRAEIASHVGGSNAVQDLAHVVPAAAFAILHIEVGNEDKDQAAVP